MIKTYTTEAYQLTIDMLTEQRAALDVVINMLVGQSRALEPTPSKTSAPHQEAAKKAKPNKILGTSLIAPKKRGRKPKKQPTLRELAIEILKSVSPSGLNTRELVDMMGQMGKTKTKSSMTTISQTLRRHNDQFGKHKGKWILLRAGYKSAPRLSADKIQPAKGEQS